MNTKFLNELREKLGVGLSEAVRLLKENGEDFEKCQKSLYDEKIAQIIAATDCLPHETKQIFVQKIIDWLTEKIAIAHEINVFGML